MCFKSKKNATSFKKIPCQSLAERYLIKARLVTWLCFSIALCGKSAVHHVDIL